MGHIFRRRQSLRRYPKKGFVIQNHNAENGLNFYCQTTVQRKQNSRTTTWAETADRAKVYDKESTAKAAMKKLQKRQPEKYAGLEVCYIEQFMVSAFEIDTNTHEIEQCKAWPEEIEGGSVFKTREEAIQSEIDSRNKNCQSLLASVTTMKCEVKELEKMLEEERERKKNVIPNIVKQLKKGE